ncbi:MAG: hypothetical protein Fur0037_25450 [Planctomycetota bacterium]
MLGSGTMGAAMWKLHRYYLRELGINASIAFVVIFAIVLISLVARGIQRAQGGGLADAALIVLFWALDSFSHVLTISFLLATVLTFARATQDREITAIRSAGISPRVPMTSAMLIGLLLSIVGSLCVHYWLPAVHFRKYRIIAEAARNLIVNMRLDGDRIPILDTGMVLHFEERDENRDYVGCTVFCPPDKIGRYGLLSPAMRVERVSIPPPDESQAALTVKLVRPSDPVTGLRFDKDIVLRIPLDPLTDRHRRKERDDDMTSDQLLSEVLRDVHPAPTAAVYTLNRRTCYAIMPALLAPIGFCIALLARERSRMVALLFSLVPLALFYAGDVFGAKLLRMTDWSGFGWLPAMILLALGTPFCWRALVR